GPAVENRLASVKSYLSLPGRTMGNNRKSFQIKDLVRRVAPPCASHRSLAHEGADRRTPALPRSSLVHIVSHQRFEVLDMSWSPNSALSDDEKRWWFWVNAALEEKKADATAIKEEAVCGKHRGRTENEWKNNRFSPEALDIFWRRLRPELKARLKRVT